MFSNEKLNRKANGV